MYSFTITYSDGRTETKSADTLEKAYSEQLKWVKKARKSNEIMEVTGVRTK